MSNSENSLNAAPFAVFVHEKDEEQTTRLVFRHTRWQHISRDLNWLPDLLSRQAGLTPRLNIMYYLTLLVIEYKSAER